MTPSSTPRPQFTVTAAPPPPARKPLRDYASRFGKWSAAASHRAVDLSWLAKGRDLLLLIGLALLVHAIWHWSAIAAEIVAGLELLWLSWSMSTPPAPPKPPPAGLGGRS